MADRVQQFDSVKYAVPEVARGISDFVYQQMEPSRPQGNTNQQKDSFATATVNAVEQGNVRSVENALKSGFEKFGGKAEALTKYLNEVSSKLTDDGFVARPTKDGLVLHRPGNENGLAFQVDSQLDPQTGSLESQIRTTPYNWTNKQDVQVPADKVMEESAKPQVEDRAFTQSLINDVSQEVGKVDMKSSMPHFNNDAVTAAIQTASKYGIRMPDGHILKGDEAVAELEKSVNDQLRAYNVKSQLSLKLDNSKPDSDYKFVEINIHSTENSEIFSTGTSIRRNSDQ